MEPLFAYLLKMIVCSAVLLGYYWFALRNERFHLWNRFYLLASMLLSVTVPMFHFPLAVREEADAIAMIVTALPWNHVSVVEESAWTTTNWLSLLVLLISAGMFFHLLFSVIRVIRLYKKLDHTLHNNISLVVTEERSAPFSFFKWLFWRKDIDPDSENGQRMLQHELTHISENHSADKLFTELLLVVFWMNPFFWLIRRELFAIHEFLADQKAIARHDGAAFAAMILQAYQTAAAVPLSNPLFTSQLKRRLVMITTSKEPKYSYLRRVCGLVLMLTTGVILVLGIENAVAQKPPPPPPVPSVEPLPDSIISIRILDRTGDPTIQYLMKDGRNLAMKISEAKKLGYPIPPPPPALPDSISSVSIKEINKQHRATFTMKDGRVLTMSVTEAREHGYPLPPPPPPPAKLPVRPPVPAVPPVAPVPPRPEREWEDAANGVVFVKGVPAADLNVLHENFDAPPLILFAGLEITEQQMHAIDPARIAGVNVLKNTDSYGEKGKNGVILIEPKPFGVAPVSPEITVRGYRATIKPTSSVKEQSLIGYPGANVLVIVDGKKSNSTSLKVIPPDQIESINVLKENAAVEKYGDEGKNGVVEVTLKPMAVYIESKKLPNSPGG